MVTDKTFLFWETPQSAPWEELGTLPHHRNSDSCPGLTTYMCKASQDQGLASQQADLAEWKVDRLALSPGLSNSGQVVFPVWVSVSLSVIWDYFRMKGEGLHCTAYSFCVESPFPV